MVDERVRIAVENWAPRFVNNGVDLNDFQRVTARVQRWDDWCHEWSDCGAAYERMGEQAEAQGCYFSAGQHYFHAAMAYHFGKFLFVHRPDELRVAHEHVVRDYQCALPFFDFPGERILIPYEDGGTMPAILRKPWPGFPPVRPSLTVSTGDTLRAGPDRSLLQEKAGQPRPAVVILIPGLDSVKEELHAYGDDFLRRGMAVLAIDGPGQGEMEFDHPMRFDYEVPVGCAINYLRSRTDVDAARVGLLGVSMGGYYAPRAAAFDPRISAAISLAGPLAIADHFDSAPLLTREAFVARLGVADEAAARSALEKFDLRDHLQKVRCPLLVIMGRQDRIVPPEEAERMAAEAGGKTELWMFEEGNHVCNNIPFKHRPQQADWMYRQLCG